MANGCVWIITIGAVDGAAQSVASELQPYGLNVQGQKWPIGEKQPWLASAKAAADQSGQVVIVVTTKQYYTDPSIRRELALFRLLLQTQLNRPVEGFVIFSETADAIPALTSGTTGCLLGDWEVAPSDVGWAARVVARLHAPRPPQWPAKLALIARENGGIWLSVSPLAGQSLDGCLVGVSGNESDISFHAVGPLDGLPQTSINEYEIKGMAFDAGGQSFKAWALQNMIDSKQAYYVRLEGEPNVIAIGQLPNGQVDDVDLLTFA